MEGHGLIAVPAPDGKGVEVTVPEHVADPSDRQPGEELGEETTLPKKGLPWPLKLGVEKSGRLAPLGVH